jgi:hypothetical protein
MKIYIITLIAVLLAPCQQQSIITDIATIGKDKFELIQKGEQAFLIVNSKNIKIEGNLKLTPPCYFLREKSQIQTFTYSDVKVDKVLIIIGNIAGNDDKKHYGVNDNRICGKKIQGLIFKGNKAILTEKTIDGALSCKDNGLDEKDFCFFAHPQKK